LDKGRWDDARRLLHDETLTTADRVAGLLLLFYAQRPALQNGTHLAPYLRHRLQTKHDQIDTFLNNHAHREDCIP
jgi:hypothetical protein